MSNDAALFLDVKCLHVRTPQLDVIFYPHKKQGKDIIHIATKNTGTGPGTISILGKFLKLLQDSMKTPRSCTH